MTAARRASPVGRPTSPETGSRNLYFRHPYVLTFVTTGRTIVDTRTDQVDKPPRREARSMTGYRHSPLADEAPGVVETVTPWAGQTMGGRVPAFIGLAQRTGGVFLETSTNGESVPTVAERLVQVGLDYEVTLEDLKVTVPGMNADGEFEVREEPMPHHRATVARYPDGRITPFGPVGTRYTPIQNMTVANLGQTVVDGGDGSLVAIGAYGDPIGSHVYMAFDLGDFTVGGSDLHKLALTLDTAHDGSGGLTASADPTRVRCTNACSGMFGRRRGSSYTIRHTEC